MTRALDLFWGSQSDFQTFVDEFFLDFPFRAFHEVVYASGYPLANIYMNEEKDVKVELTITGLSKENISLFVEDDCLIIKGELPFSKDDITPKWRLVEGKIKKDSFEKRIRLSNKLDYAKAQAEVANGLLTIIIPSKESSTKKQISIK